MVEVSILRIIFYSKVYYGTTKKSTLNYDHIVPLYHFENMKIIRFVYVFRIILFFH